MSTFTDQMYGNAATSARGLVTGSLDAPVRRSWGEVHQQARKMAGALANAGVGPGSVVAVLAGDPADVAPLAQAVWMRGASLSMLQQPTPRTDLAVWLADTDRAARTIEQRQWNLPFHSNRSGNCWSSLFKASRLTCCITQNTYLVCLMVIWSYSPLHNVRVIHLLYKVGGLMLLAALQSTRSTAHIKTC